MNNMMSYGVLRREGGREGGAAADQCCHSLQACSQFCSSQNTRYQVYLWAWLGLCRQELPVISSITFISSNWNDKYGDLKQPGPSKTASVNKSLSTWGDLMTFLQRREDTCSYYYNKEFLRTVDPIIQNFQTKSKANKLQKFETELLNLSVRNYMET